LENFMERAVILTRGKSLESPLAEMRKLNTDEPAHVPAPRGREDIAQIVKETINALDGKKSVADDYARQQRGKSCARSPKARDGSVGLMELPHG
jgi:hypothetical protein